MSGKGSENAPLTPNQKIFVAEYLACGNAEEAYARSGYAGGQGGRTTSHYLMSRPNIQREIRRQTWKLTTKLNIKAEALVQEMARLAFSNVANCLNENGTLKSWYDIDQDTLAAVKTYKIKYTEKEDGIQIIDSTLSFHDKVAAQGNLAKHLGLFEDHIRIHFTQGDSSRGMPDLTALTPDERETLRELMDKIEAGPRTIEADPEED